MNTPQKPELKLSYEFNAPKELVFGAFSTMEALGEWWGPVEMKNTPIRLDFRTGGIFHYRMEGMGQVNYGCFVFGEIRPYDVLEFTNAFADEHANIVKAPFDITLPEEIFYRLEFTEKNGKTTIHLTGTPVRASEEEQEGFLSINESMHDGFGATFDKLVIYLQKTNA